MDLTVEDLRSELEKRGLDSEGNREDLQARLEQAHENEKDKTLETSQTESTEKNPEAVQKTDKKEDPVKKEEMVATKEGGGGDVVENETKVDNSEEKSQPTSSAKETSKEEKKEDPTSATVDNTSSQQKTIDNDEAVGDNKTTDNDNDDARDNKTTDNDAATGDNKTTDNDAATGDNKTTDNDAAAGDNKTTDNDSAGDNKTTDNDAAGDNKTTDNDAAGDNKTTDNDAAAGDNKTTDNKTTDKDAAGGNKTTDNDAAAGDNKTTDNDAAAGDNKTTDNDDATEDNKITDDDAARDNKTTAETKDSTANPPATKGEENESLIVLVDDTQNDLDADLLAKEKANNKNEKKSDDASAGSSTCNVTEAESKNKGGAGGEEDNANKGNTGEKTEKKTDEKKDEKKDGKLKSSSAVSRIKSSKNASSGNPNSCNLWISGLSTNTKATHLKSIFTKYGKVIGAKVVTNANSAGARCYGFLTMSSPEEATKCIANLNQKELHGRLISVERAKTTPGLQPLKKIKPGTKQPEKTDVKKSEEKSPNKKPLTTEKKSEGNSPTKKPSEKKSVSGKSTPKKSDKPEVKKDGKSQSLSEKGDSHSKKPKLSSDKSKTRTPSKRSSHSHSPRRPHSSGERSSGKIDRDCKVYLELKQRKTYLERAVQRQKRRIDCSRLVELELQTRQKEEAYRLKRVRDELRHERERLERKRMKLERAEQNRIWKERQEAEMFNGIERERHAVKRPYERKPAHNYFWDEPKRPNVSSSGASRFSRSSFPEETWFTTYYNRDNKPMEQVGRFSDSNLGRINAHSPQRPGLERYGPQESSSRLTDHTSSDNRFERRDLGSGGYHGHDTDHRNLAAERGREIDRRNVSAHERLGRVRNQPVGGSNWKVDNWSRSHGGMDTGHHQWVNNNNMNPSYERGNTGGVSSGNGGFPSGSGSSGGGLPQNMGMGNMFNTAAQQPSMMAGGSGGGGNMGSRMQEPRFDAYKNMEHGGMRRY